MSKIATYKEIRYLLNNINSFKEDVLYHVENDETLSKTNRILKKISQVSDELFNKTEEILENPEKLRDYQETYNDLQNDMDNIIFMKNKLIKDLKIQDKLIDNLENELEIAQETIRKLKKKLKNKVDVEKTPIVTNSPNKFLLNDGSDD